MADPFGDREFLAGAGTETYLLFQQGFAMREFCAFEVFDDETAVGRMEADVLFPLLDAAEESGRGLVVDALVWRAHPDYVARLGYAPGELARLNQRAVERTRASVRVWRGAAADRAQMPVLVAADLGPRGDGYQVADADVTPESARAYHGEQVAVLAEAGVDVVCALTMTTAAEAVGIVRAACEHGLPIVVSPTVETDGRLPDGMALGEFIRRVDDATAGSCLFYMVNCAHPSHLAATLERAAEDGEDWLDRFRGLRANASTKSHAELDESSELDRGDPAALAREVAELKRRYGLRLVGGCCGTDAEHVRAMAVELGRGGGRGENGLS